MIKLNVKKRQVALVIRQREALLRRLTVHSPKRKKVNDSLEKRWAGHKGELSLDYDLRFLPYNSYRIIQGIRLLVFNKGFQIDTLILSPHAAFIVEAKNHNAETVFYDEESQQFKKKVNGVIVPMEDPLIQVTRQKQQLEEWLQYRGIHGYPIIPIVAICNPSTIVIPPKGHTHNWPIMNSVHIVDRIQQFEKVYQNRNTFDVERISKALIAEEVPLEQDLLTKYTIKSSDIVRGVMCPKCSMYAMERVQLRWQCPKCGFRSLNAHLLTIADYFLLSKSSITNKEFRSFAGVSDMNVALRMLKSSGLEFNGDTKGRVYQRPKDMLGFLDKAFKYQK